MKKKIIIILGTVSLLFVFGGIYLIKSIETNAMRFDELLMFHKVEILRENLLLNIRRAEADLYSQGTRHAESAVSVERHVDAMKNTINVCFGCHHQESVLRRLQDLQHQVEQYGQQIGKGLTVKADAGSLRVELERAHLIGDSLISEINTMIVITNKKLSQQTDDILREVRRTKIMLIMVIAAGPFIIALMAFSVLRGITRPIQALLNATRNLQTGNFEYRVAGLRDEFGELAVGFNVMASSLKEHMKKIEESEKRYRLLFESAGDGIFILDGEGDNMGKIVAANQAAVKMHGYTLEELLTMNIRDLDDADSSAKVPERIERIFQGEWFKREINHVRKDGTVFPVAISAGLLEMGDHRYILAIDSDVTERKQAEETLQRTEQLKTTGELAAGLAHEIKNPLAGIKASIEILSTAPYLPEEDKRILVLVIGEIKRIELLIRDLLNFARPSRPQFEDTDVNAVLNAVAGMVLKNPRSPADSSKSISVVKDLEENLPGITADPMQLKQVFMNLMLNAVDAMQGSGTLGIKTRFESAARAILIEVSDTGKVPDPSVMNKIFQPFFTTKPKGTGMGLAISKRLIENHRGTIGAVKNGSGGVTFKMSLPITQEIQKQMTWPSAAL
ncbi:MAG TPA: PAS domain S-box protein [Nitrospirota bacterium]|nr:PAS domain S-box protein [Nitrospirota bacterium]